MAQEPGARLEHHQGNDVAFSVMVGASNPYGSRMLPIVGGMVIVAIGLVLLLIGILLVVLQYYDYSMYAIIIGLVTIAVGIGLDLRKNGQ